MGIYKFNEFIRECELLRLLEFADFSASDLGFYFPADVVNTFLNAVFFKQAI